MDHKFEIQGKISTFNNCQQSRANHTKRKKKNRSRCCCPGSNWGPSVCKTDVITTTPQQLFVPDAEANVFNLSKTIVI